MNILNERTYDLKGIVSKTYALITSSKTFNLISTSSKTFAIRIAHIVETLLHTLGDHDTKTLGEMDTMTLGELDSYEA